MRPVHITRVSEDEIPPALRKNTLDFAKISRSRRAGISYEKEVHQKVLLPLEASGVVIEWQPWFRIGRGKGVRFIHPDLLLLLPDHRVVVGDIKLRATKAAFRKIKLDYARVVQGAYPPGTRVDGLKICQWYDPDEQWKKSSYRFVPAPSLENLPDSPLMYHIWNPRYA